MAGERRYTRIPPESTGDRIKISNRIVIPYDNKDAAYQWVIGDSYIVTGDPEVGVIGQTMNFVINDFVEDTTSAGVLYVTFDKYSNYVSRTPLDNQEIRDSDNTLRGYVNGAYYSEYINQTQIVGNSNSEYAANVDRFGSLNVRFAEGQANLDAFGNLKVGNSHLLANYDFSKDPLAGQFANSVEGEGTKTWDPDIGAYRLTVDKQGDRVTNTSNLFHPVTNGNATLYELSARCGDSGAVDDGTVRFWGAFDATDGYFFALAENNIQVRHRFTLDGNATTDMVINQSSWNVDTLDGSGDADNPSGMNLDVSKINLYWIDYQFLGGGRTRWGVYYEGERIVCHQMISTNVDNHHPLSNPARPICWAIAKPASLGPTADGYKDFFAYGAAVYTNNSYDPLKESAREFGYYNNSFQLSYDSTSTTYMYTLRPQITLPWSGKENHTIYTPTSLDIYPHTDRNVIGEITNTSSDSTYWTITTDEDHHFTAGDNVDIFNTTSFNGRWLVFDAPSSTTFRIANTSTPTNETSGTVQDTDSESMLLYKPETEVRIFAKCIMRGVSFSPISYTTAEADTYGDHLAHGPEIARFVATDRILYSFAESVDSIQYGAVYNTSDQSFARQFQSLELIQGNDDKYSTGVQRVRVTIRDNSHPIFGTTIHYFDDMGKVIFRGEDGVTTLSGFSSGHDLLTADTGNAGTWYYLSLLDRDEAWLYNSTSDIDDDRSVRVLQLTADPTGTIAVGDTITLDTGGQTAIAKTIYVSGTDYYLGVEARSGTDFDGYTGTINATAFTVSGVTKSSDRIGSWSGIGGGTWDERDERTTFDLDYKTSLLAIDSSGWGNPNDTVSNQNRLYGPTPVQPAWTFMIRHLHKTTHDTNVRTVMRWKERIQ